MKRKLIFLPLLWALIFMSSGDLQAKKSLKVNIGKGEARIGYLDGTVRVLPKGTQGWRALHLQNILRGGDEVAVGSKSRLEMIFPDQSRLRFADDTRFTILHAGDESAPDVKVRLAVGRTWANVSKSLGIKRKFEISSDNAVAGVRGTVYRMNVDQDASALVRVYDGEIAVSGATKPLEAPKAIGPPTKIAGPTKVTMEEWTVIIRSRQQITVGPDGAASKPREFTEQEDRDEWVDWNKARDAER
ncbi:MAG: FecR protein [Thermodesulfobacteriota bacterium]|nr:FecR protein [Thermodesulfobacteriota bacterium]